MNIRIHTRWALPATLACAGLLLQACGGSDGGGGGSGGNTSTLSGKVLGSLVEGAVVCVDENENGRCDSTDQHRITSTADGEYTISDIPDALFERPIVVDVPLTAMVVDPVSGARSPVATEYRLHFPPDASAERHVSSLSTLVNSEFLRLGDVDMAADAVSNRLDDAGIDIAADDLLDDYVADATGSGASGADIERYNVAKLAGQVMQVGQSATASNVNVDANALMRLVAQRVFDSIDAIEQSARDNQTLINQASAAAIVDGIGETRNLQITEADIETAAQIAALSFDLGPAAYANVLNFKESNAAAEWRRVSYIRFETPGGADGRDVHDYRATIPADYEIGVLGANGDVQMTMDFDEQQWEDGADPQYWYSWEESNSVFAIYTRAASGDWAEGDYEYVLCPTGCANGDRIYLADARLAPYDTDLGIGSGAHFMALDDLVGNDLQFIASDTDGRRDGDQQLVTVAQPSPPHGSYYNIYLGVDDDGDGVADSNRSRPTDRSMNRMFVPIEWLDQPRDFVASISHRDRSGWENVSWEARSDAQPTAVTRASSFPTEEIFDVYRGEIRDGSPFREGLDSNMHVYLAEGNPLTGLAYEDETGTEVARVCLPGNIPTSQSALASYGALHANDGNDQTFDGCTTDLFDEFGLDGDSRYAEVRLEGTTSYSVDEEVLEIGHYMIQADSNDQWGEPGEIFQDMKTVVFEFQNGDSFRMPTDLLLPEHDFTIAGDAEIDYCSVGQDSLRIAWTPPGWMLDEFAAGELSVSLRVRARDGNGNQIGSYTNRTRKGALSTVVSKSLLQNLAGPGVAIDHYRVEPYIGDMDYYDWKHRTYWTRIRQEVDAADLISSPDCL